MQEFHAAREGAAIDLALGRSADPEGDDVVEGSFHRRDEAGLVFGGLELLHVGVGLAVAVLRCGGAAEGSEFTIGEEGVCEAFLFNFVFEDVPFLHLARLDHDLARAPIYEVCRCGIIEGAVIRNFGDGAVRMDYAGVLEACESRQRVVAESDGAAVQGSLVCKILNFAIIVECSGSVRQNADAGAVQKDDGVKAGIIFLGLANKR